METLDEIDNLGLIENSLIHLRFELARERTSYFRIAREAHLLLYRSMIEALKGSANLPVTGRPSRDRSCRYRIEFKSCQEIHREEIKGCSKAWRFSQLEPCKPTKIASAATASRKRKCDDYLISFYDALAMIQTECFMKRFVDSNVVSVSDSDMKTLEWLYEEIRNEYEHFVPRFYLAPVQDLLAAAELCLRLSSTLLFDCGNVIFCPLARKQPLKRLVRQVVAQLIDKTRQKKQKRDTSHLRRR